MRKRRNGGKRAAGANLQFAQRLFVVFDELAFATSDDAMTLGLEPTFLLGQPAGILRV